MMKLYLYTPDALCGLDKRRTAVGQALDLVPVLDDVHERNAGHLAYPAAKVAIALGVESASATRI